MLALRVGGLSSAGYIPLLMERIWAPWRKEFILKAKESGCLFCELPDERADRKSLILFRGPRTYAVLNRYPYTNGHLMVVPYRHTAELDDLTRDEAGELWELARRSVNLLRAAYRPQGFNLGLNLGRAAGAGVVDHLHLHVVPRWAGDNNFMPVIGNTKVHSLSLDETFRVLARGFRQKGPPRKKPKVQR